MSTATADSVIASRGADPAAVTHEGEVVRNKYIRGASVAYLFMGEYLLGACFFAWSKLRTGLMFRARRRAR